MLIAGSIFAVLAALIHVYIFFLESVAWSGEKTWRLFGLRSQQEADTVKPMAFNQGFYNLFLAIGVGVGLVLLASTSVAQAGFGVLIASLSSMVLAAVVLITSNPKLARSAAIQGIAPLIAVVLLLVAILG
ncbi:DUF1304 domain-containing protein [Schumannella sp. 10F1B-5-1]|uniref:DUF1304 domain-containing protein n=1 Tax=Schumannella sp. 10F1B-5-1 TaxID=2590780 RepID=UPI0011323D7D|nr:DUF1304 domain-containing protein [Schumannella sp. 10F1B-5-1]TPW78547.1 DUF1304 domain-containing protein [Schumannella sp. 10F1B-5-1]